MFVARRVAGVVEQMTSLGPALGNQVSRHQSRSPQSVVERIRAIARLAVLVAAAVATGAVGGWDARAETSSYVMGAGDRLRITVFGQPDLSGEVEVGPTGSLSLPLIGTVPAFGLTPRQLELSVVDRLKQGYLINPRVTVEVIEYRPFYILGDVKNPASYSYVSGMTVLTAIVLAGGYLLTEEENVRLRLEVTRARENLDLLRGDYWAATAREARLIAERDGLKKIRYRKDILRLKNDPKVVELIEGERRLFNTRRKALAGQIAVLERQKSQSREHISALEAQMEADARQLELVDSQIRDVEKLLAKGFARKTTLTDLQRAAARIQGDRLENLALIARVRQSIGEAELKIINSRNARLNQVVDELQDTQKSISDLEKRLMAAREVLREIEAKLGHAAAGLLAQRNSAIIITRDVGNGPEKLEATEITVVNPGDIIRVPGFFTAPSYPSPISSSIETGATVRGKSELDGAVYRGGSPE